MIGQLPLPRHGTGYRVPATAAAAALVVALVVVLFVAHIDAALVEIDLSHFRVFGTATAVGQQGRMGDVACRSLGFRR